MDLSEKIMIKDDKKPRFKTEKIYYNIPMNTCNTAVWVHGVSQCAKNQNCTHTHGTRFGNTTGLPVPVTNPIYSFSL